MSIYLLLIVHVNSTRTVNLFETFVFREGKPGKASYVYEPVFSMDFPIPLVLEPLVNNYLVPPILKYQWMFNTSRLILPNYKTNGKPDSTLPMQKVLQKAKSFGIPIDGLLDRNPICRAFIENVNPSAVS